MGLLTPVAIRIGGIAWLPRFLPQITWFDQLLHRLTGGRLTLLRVAGLPSMLLTVTGRKSGVPRSTPLLCVPSQDGFLVAGSNFGGQKLPVWVYNVRSADTVTVTVDGKAHTVVPRELLGADREQAWAHMLNTWPNYAKYAERTERVIPVFVMEPQA